MKTINFWMPYFGNVGTIKAAINSAKAIKQYSKEDVQISLFKVYSEWEGYEDEILNSGLNIVDFKLKKYIKNLPKYGFLYRISMLFIMLYSIPKLVKYFNSSKPDIVISYLQAITPIIASIFSSHKPKIIVSIQGLPDFLVDNEIFNSYPLYKKIESRIRIKLWKLFYSRADRLIALTERTKDKLSKIFRFDDDKIVFISNPVLDTDIITKSKEFINDPIFFNNKVILGVGRYTHQKDFGTLIKAFSLVKKKYNSVKLVLLGEGELRQELFKIVCDLGLNNDVILYGFVKNPYKYMAKSSIFVSSSLWEDAGHVLIEAAYLKVPIVATNCPSDVDQFLMYGQSGYLCSVSDALDMSNKILDALNFNNNNKINLAYLSALEFTDKKFYDKISLLI